MLCPHCYRTIEEQDHYLMSQRVPKDQPLPESARRLATVGACVLAFLLLSWAFHLLATVA